MAQRWRAFHPGLPDQAGATIRLDPSESHHVARVLRRRPGDFLDVFDGAGREWSAVIESADPRGLVVRLVSERLEPVEAPLRVLLYQSACRPDRMDWVVQKATELGVAEIHVRGEQRRTGHASAGRGRLERWRRIAVESAKQCGRTRVPLIDVTQGWPAPSGDVLALILDERPDAPPIGDWLDGPPPPAVWLAIGPESGLSSEDVEGACGSGWRRAGLGPRTLRTETAGIVAAALVLHRWGDVGRAG